MSPQVRELCDLVIRWVHLIAGIMWIGNSLLFNWLDRNLEKPSNPEPGYQGKIWLLHSGAFYDVDKKLLRPHEMPKTLHWFKWQNFTTWTSGILLLLVVYYAGGGALLIDPSVRALGTTIAIAISLTFIVVSWFVYDLVWISPLAKRPLLASTISLLYIGAVAYALTTIFSGRAAYIHVGVILGTLMTGNVWFVIVPSQRELVRATIEGREQDASISLRAKERSIHNNYMTFPLLFMMVSNHFPITYAGRHAWSVLCVLSLGGALVRHLMNVRFTYKPWLPIAAVVVTATLGALFFLTRPEHATTSPTTSGEKVAFHTALGVIHERCQPCHSAQPTDDVWKNAPAGVMLDTPEQIKRLAPRIKERAVISRTMPLQNKTGITQAERDLIGDWIDQGAN
jgi:uncharacterized membrane protein